MIALCEQPELLKRLQDDPSLIPVCRRKHSLGKPGQTFMRSATRDTQIRGIDIKKDEWMMSNLPAPAAMKMFTKTRSFDITRKPNRHMALAMARMYASASIWRVWKCVFSGKNYCRA